MSSLPFDAKVLEVGFFASKSTDDVAAAKLAKGTRVVAGATIDVLDPDTFDEAESWPRGRLLELHSLRWADVLRRTAQQNPQRPDLLFRVIDAWWRSSSAGNPTSAAWADHVLIQRSTVIGLALLAFPRDGYEHMLTAHVNALRRLEQTSAGYREKLAMAQIKATLLTVGGADADGIAAGADESAQLCFSREGYAPASDLNALVEARITWADFLRACGVREESVGLQRTRSADFWVHALDPSGQLINFGSDQPDEVPGTGDERIRYILTQGAEGSPCGAVRLVDPSGPIVLRSGWGETERDLAEEIAVSVLAGPYRGAGAHEDLGRVTYYSQGRAWLIDPGDASVSSADFHSAMSVEDHDYRTAARADLVRSYQGEDVEGYVLNLSSFLGVRWQRHVAFARTGNYLFVEDVLRSSSEFNASQNWIVAPDVDIRPIGNGFLLEAEGKTVHLIVSSVRFREYSISDVENSEGKLAGRRISIPVSGQSSRAVALLIDSTGQETFDVKRLPARGKEVVFDVTVGKLREKLVVTPEFTATVPADLSVEEGIEAVGERAVAGTMSMDEQLEQRLETRRAIENAKAYAHENGGSAEARRAAIRQLQAARDQLNIVGLRDHGYAAAIIDLAGTDLTDDVSDDKVARASRRTPLIAWPGSELIQPSYGLKVTTTSTTSEFPLKRRPSSIWSVDLGQLTLSTLINESPGDVLTVYFHGSTDRSRFAMPRYERLRSMSGLGLGPVMFFSDPTLDLDSRMMLSWYAGTEDLHLHREIAAMIAACAQGLQIEKVLLVGNSGGGFTSLQIAAHLKGAQVVSFNPQVRIDDYTPRIAEVAHWAIFGRETVSDDPVFAPRMDLIERYRRIDFDQSAVLIQNPGDDHHYTEHFKPFVQSYVESGNADRLKLLTPDLGPGHRVPPVTEYMRIVRESAAEFAESPWRLDGLRPES